LNALVAVPDSHDSPVVADYGVQPRDSVYYRPAGTTTIAGRAAAGTPIHVDDEPPPPGMRRASVTKKEVERVGSNAPLLHAHAGMAGTIVRFEHFRLPELPAF
jgi:hypothetical protein